MSGQVARATCLAALIAVVAAGLVALGLVRHAYDEQARSVLRRDAELVAQTVRPAAANEPARTGRPALRLLRLAGVSLTRVSADGTVHGRNLLTPPEARAAQDGRPVSAARQVGGHRVFMESAPVPGDGSVVLTQRVSDATAVTPKVLRRLALAMLIGLLAAAGLGVMVARRLTRPLVRAADGAHRLALGQRDVQLPLDGPVEVAELANGLNRLSTALTVSEGRQREFLLSISHELRTPLTAIRGYAEAVGDGVATGHAAQDAGRTIEAEAQRLERLVRDLLDLARLGADDFRLELTDVDLVALAEIAAPIWAARCDAAGVPFTVELSTSPVLVKADPGRIRQVLDNLAENALRVTPAGQPIVLSVRAEPDAGVLEIRDGGPGLRAEDLPVAFDQAVLYNRYRGVRKVGTGLGLALVAGLVTRLGGRATASAAPEGGAAFTIRLPRA
jgi:two-component system sensor histidine kinase BaeS